MYPPPSLLEEIPCCRFLVTRFQFKVLPGWIWQSLAPMHGSYASFWPLFWDITNKEGFSQWHEKWRRWKETSKMSKGSKIWEHHHGFLWCICTLAFEKQCLPFIPTSWPGRTSLYSHPLQLFPPATLVSVVPPIGRASAASGFLPGSLALPRTSTSKSIHGWFLLYFSVLNLNVAFWGKTSQTTLSMDGLTPYSSHILPHHPILFASLLDFVLLVYFQPQSP